MHNIDIDLVYLWADGSDAEWMAKKNRFLGKDAGTNTEATSIARNADNDELRYSLRSVEKYAYWIRKIFIVTDEQIPEWLNLQNEKVKIVDIREILPAAALPCYNSVIIEHFLYKIPGLSEHFLYANDDMFINAPVHVDTFFNQKGFPIIRLQRVFCGKFINKLRLSMKIHTNIYRKTMHNAALLIDKKFGKYYSGIPHHNIDAFLKSDYRKVVEQDFSQEIMSTIHHHIRSENDIQRIIYLYYLLANKKGQVRYVNRYESSRIRIFVSDYSKFLNKYQSLLFCLNDSHRATNEDRKRIKPFLETLFPDKSEFEK